MNKYIFLDVINDPLHTNCELIINFLDYNCANTDGASENDIVFVCVINQHRFSRVRIHMKHSMYNIIEANNNNTQKIELPPISNDVAKKINKTN